MRASLKPKSGPVEVIEAKGIKVPIYRTPAFGKTSYTLAFYAEGRRVRERAGSLEGARQRAKLVIKELISGKAHVSTFTPRQTAVVTDAVEIIKDTGVPLSQVAREYADAIKILAGKGSVIEAARFYIAEKSKTSLVEIKFSDAVQKFLKRNEDMNFSEEYKTDCRKHLQILSKSFGAVRLQDICQQEITAALRKATQGLSVRRFKNLRGTMNALFSYAQGEGWLARDRKHEAALVEIPNDRTIGAIEIYTPDQLVIVLNKIAEDMRPWVALSGLAGMRTSEIHRMTWEMIRFDAKVIVLEKSFTKTKRRRIIPMCPALVDWLKPCASKGRLYDCSLGHFQGRMTKAWPRGDDGEHLVPKKMNALRHSFGTYRFALLQDENKVSAEMGNSPSELREHYAEIALPGDAEKWFAIVPEKKRGTHAAKAAV